MVARRVNDCKFLLPVSSTEDPDIVVIKVLHVLGGIYRSEVGLVRLCAWAHHDAHGDVLIIPLRNEAHASECLSRTLTMADDGDLLVAIALAHLTDDGRQVIDAKFRPVHCPELLVRDRVLVMLLRVISSRVVSEPHIVAHSTELECHGKLWNFSFFF